MHSESEDSKIRTLLQGLELGDQRPSQLLTRMRSLAGDNVGEPILKSLWLGRLPNGTQIILAALNENLDQLATVADKINDLTFPKELIQLQQHLKKNCPIRTTNCSTYTTRADISVIPKSFAPHAKVQQDLTLYAVNGTKIPTYGTKRILLDLELSTPTLNYLLPKIKSVASNLEILVGNTKFDKVLKQYPELINPSQPINVDTSNQVYHHTGTKGPPVFSKPRRFTPTILKAVKKEFKYLMAQGIIRPSKSPWASPLHVVKKSNGEYRPCGDYRRLNSVTAPDRYPVPHIQDCTQNLYGKTIFTTLDLARAYHQIAINPPIFLKQP
ncbi:retrovirus-related Pol polyprotein from transposon opus [Trichonephila clavipes]|nr:retrovirus-related Pol polyprotein from transposon opus [Trichonephila clavipes]